jgi:hypothetical protein
MEEMATQVRSYARPGWIVGNPSMIRSPISKLGLDADSVIDFRVARHSGTIRVGGRIESAFRVAPDL